MNKKNSWGFFFLLKVPDAPEFDTSFLFSDESKDDFLTLVEKLFFGELNARAEIKKEAHQKIMFTKDWEIIITEKIVGGLR